MDTTLQLDLLRVAHLLFVVLGMGPALYFDLRSFFRMTQPLTPSDIAELHRIHWLVTAACVGLWLTGVALIWWRTGFDLAAFTPKLWCKLIIVSLLTANAFFLALVVIPALTNYQGLRLLDLPTGPLLTMSCSAGLSLACWVLALQLGASTILKTATWDVLLTVMTIGGALCIAGVVTIIFGLRAVLPANCKPGTDISKHALKKKLI